MKVKKDTALFSILTGSHLYGTNGPNSDYDYKAVCLPSLDDVLLNVRIINKKEKPEGLSDHDRMIAGGTETEYLPLQVFFNDFYDGQTYALEVAFASIQGLAIFNEDLTTADVAFINKMMRELIDNFLTNNVKKMVGYAVAQSRLYGLKTQRYTSLGAALRVFKHFQQWADIHMTREQWATTTLDASPTTQEQLLQLEHVKRIEIMNADGGTKPAPGIEICGKQYSLTNRITTIMKSIEKSLSNYGDRVKEFDGHGVDWKALSHAIRITEQVIELSECGCITFPRPNAEFIRSVKAGELSLEDATDYLDREFARIDEAVAKSVLQARTPELDVKFREWKIEQLRHLYGV